MFSYILRGKFHIFQMHCEVEIRHINVLIGVKELEIVFINNVAIFETDFAIQEILYDINQFVAEIVWNLIVFFFIFGIQLSLRLLLFLFRVLLEPYFFLLEFTLSI